MNIAVIAILLGFAAFVVLSARDAKADADFEASEREWWLIEANTFMAHADYMKAKNGNNLEDAHRVAQRIWPWCERAESLDMPRSERYQTSQITTLQRCQTLDLVPLP
jgi:hypothetical protein